jgi:predicted metal-dependent hydrolase
MPKFSKKIYDSTTLKIDNLEILILRKAVKKIYLRIATNDGKIHLVAPRKPSIQYLKNLVIDKLSWIKKHHEEFSKKNIGEIKFINGEIIEFLGKKFQLEIVKNQEKTIIFSDYEQKITINLSTEISLDDYQKLLSQFYRLELRKILIPMISKWQKKMNLQSNFIGIKKMKTKWGSCNYVKARLWFSLELAKKPLEAIEYVVVHELGHLIEPSHNKKFVAVMNQFLPEWQNHKAKLR